jgi:hypothetical protein
MPYGATMSHQESTTLLTTSFAGIMFAAVGGPDPIQLFPISAGITGAVLAVMRGQGEAKGAAGRLRWVSSVIAGVAAAIFVSPVFCNRVLGWESVQLLAFGSLLFGLIGSTLVDVLLQRRERVAKILIDKSIEQWVKDTAANDPTGPVHACPTGGPCPVCPVPPPHPVPEVTNPDTVK